MFGSKVAIAYLADGHRAVKKAGAVKERSDSFLDLGTTPAAAWRTVSSSSVLPTCTRPDTIFSFDHGTGILFTTAIAFETCTTAPIAVSFFDVRTRVHPPQHFRVLCTTALMGANRHDRRVARPFKRMDALLTRQPDRHGPRPLLRSGSRYNHVGFGRLPAMSSER